MGVLALPIVRNRLNAMLNTCVFFRFFDSVIDFLFFSFAA